MARRSAGLDNDTPQRAHTHSHERGVAQVADAHSGVEALLQEIHHAIDQDHLHLRATMALKERETIGAT